jgi:hypothetical protein
LKQLTKIECHQARIRQIHSQINAKKHSGKVQTEVEFATSSKSHFHIGKSQNESEILPVFLQKNAGDPAIKVGLINK